MNTRLLELHVHCLQMFCYTTGSGRKLDVQSEGGQRRTEWKVEKKTYRWSTLATQRLGSLEHPGTGYSIRLRQWLPVTYGEGSGLGDEQGGQGGKTIPAPPGCVCTMRLTNIISRILLMRGTCRLLVRRLSRPEVFPICTRERVLKKREEEEKAGKRT